MLFHLSRLLQPPPWVKMGTSQVFAYLNAAQLVLYLLVVYFLILFVSLKYVFVLLLLIFCPE